MKDCQFNIRRHISIACYLLVAVYFVLTVYLFSGLAAGPGRFYRSGVPAGADFLQIWAASSLAARGDPAQAYDPGALKKVETAVAGGDFPGTLPWHYPPSFLLLVLPFSGMNYLAALAVWLVVSLSGFLFVLYRIYPDRLTVWLALASIATAQNLYFGQGAFLIGLLLGGGLLLLDGHPLLAGVLFTLVLNYKPHLGMLLPVALLAGRKWRALGSLAAAGAVLILASAWIFGPHTWAAFWTDLARMRGQLAGAGNLWDRMPTVFAAVRLLGGVEGLAQVLQILAALGAAACVYRVWRRDEPLPNRGAALVLGSLLATPHALSYDLALLLLPIAWVARKGLEEQWGRGLVFLLLSAWLAPFLDLVAVQALKVHLAPAIFAVFLIYLSARTVKRGQGERPPAPACRQG